jgi:hypothetical protein
MLTYRTGAAGAPSAARLMSEHLLQQTLTPEMAAMAEYYEQGVRPPTPADAVAARYGRLSVGGMLHDDALLDEAVKTEIDRLVENVPEAAGRPSDWDGLVIKVLGTFVAAGMASLDRALRSAGRLKASANVPELESAAKKARTEKDYSSATATPRRDMHPALAKRLGINPHRGLRPNEVAFLLNGQRADGGLIEGRAQQSASLPLAQQFGLDSSRRPTRAELENVLAGRKGNGEILPAKEAKNALRRLFFALGIKSKSPSSAERENILAGRFADGRDLSDRDIRAILETSKSRIGYIDLTFSAPKSVSIAWAFAPTPAERAIIHQAHKDAIDSTMLAIEKTIGRASMGRSARFGFEPGAIGWVSFDHYAARPTVEVVSTDDLGQPVTELHRLTSTKGRVPGDMQVHTHVAIPNIVETPSGRVGGLDFAQLEGRIHEWGALYQAYLASNLREHGVEIELDQRTELAKLSAIPDDVVSQFSRRTVNGTDAARAYAVSQGLVWDELNSGQKVGLLKSGVQNRREGKADDIGDIEAWRRLAESIGYEHPTVLNSKRKEWMCTREQRLERAYQAAAPLLARQFNRRAVIDGAEMRVAAAKGLIVAGVQSAVDVDAVVRAFRDRGIRQGSEAAALVWGTVKGGQGRNRIAITTTLEIREEQRLIQIAQSGARDLSSALTQRQIQAAVAAFPAIDFTTEHGRAQKQVIDRIGTGGRISLAIGVAGSGKSTLLKPLVKAWVDDCRTVHGIALAWRQSDDLTEAGILAHNTRAVASFLYASRENLLSLDRRSVVVVDEVGLLGTGQLNAILALQQQLKFQLVMLGDPRQMQSVEAGAVISLLHRALGTMQLSELTSSVRQSDAEERETVLMFRNDQADEAIKRKDKNGTLRIAPGGYREAIEYVADLWLERKRANLDRRDFSISVSAPTNTEAHEISLAIRARRKRENDIGVDEIVVQAEDGGGDRNYDLALARGDRIRLFRRVNARFTESNTVGNIGRNGTVLKLLEIRDEGLLFQNYQGREGMVKWSSLKDEKTGRLLVAYGDVLTTNTAQGTTVTEHIYANPDGTKLASAFSAYTSGSRHREQSFIVVSEGVERKEVEARRPIGDKREAQRSDILDNIIRNFSRRPVKEAALDMLVRAADIRRGTIRTVQDSLHLIESTSDTGEPNYSLGRNFSHIKMIAALVDMSSRFEKGMWPILAAFGRVERAAAGILEKLTKIIRSTRLAPDNEKNYWQQSSELGKRIRKRGEPIKAKSSIRTP